VVTAVHNAHVRRYLAERCRDLDAQLRRMRIPDGCAASPIRVQAKYFNALLLVEIVRSEDPEVVTRVPPPAKPY
jgi:hypothetical protein